MILAETLVMGTVDFIVIYLACGAPFGVFHFLKTKRFNISNYLETMAIALLWLPYSVYLLINLLSAPVSRTNKLMATEFEIDKEIEVVKRKLEFFVPKDASPFIFEFREITERYAGLTLAKNVVSDKPSDNLEIFRISSKGDPEAGTICLNRRNQKKLESHQEEARKEFFCILEKFMLDKSNRTKLAHVSRKFVTLLNDDAALELADNLATSQEIPVKTVKVPEHELWNPEKPQPLIHEANSRSLKA